MSKWMPAETRTYTHEDARALVNFFRVLFAIGRIERHRVIELAIATGAGGMMEAYFDVTGEGISKV